MQRGASRYALDQTEQYQKLSSHPLGVVLGWEAFHAIRSTVRRFLDHLISAATGTILMFHPRSLPRGRFRRLPRQLGKVSHPYQTLSHGQVFSEGC